MTFRPGFMTATILVAIIATPGIGLMAAHADPVGRQEDEKLAEQRVDEEQAGLGWLAAGDVFERARDAADRVQRTSGVGVRVAQRPFDLLLYHGHLRCQPASESLVVDAIDTIERELAKYPADCLRHARLRRILLCRDLHEESMAIPSLPNFQSTLLLDANASEGYLRRVLHHEVFHFVDFATRGDIARDTRWASLNPPSFEYGGGGRIMRNVPVLWQSERRGFVTFYAQSALEEDKAEVFAMWMATPDRLHAMAGKDPIVAAKTLAVHEQVVALCPAMRSRLKAK